MTRESSLIKMAKKTKMKDNEKDALQKSFAFVMKAFSKKK